MDVVTDGSSSDVHPESAEGGDTPIGDASNSGGGEELDHSDSEDGSEDPGTKDSGVGETHSLGDRETSDEGTSDGSDLPQIESGHSDVEPDAVERVQEETERVEQSGGGSGFEPIHHAYGCF